MNQLYKRDEYIVFPVEDCFIVCNTKKVFQEGHCHQKRFDICKLLISLAIEKKLPNNPHLVDSLIRLTDDKKYIEQLKEFKETIVTDKDIQDFMRHDSYVRHKGALRRR
jgi:hypothetical protein